MSLLILFIGMFFESSMDKLQYHFYRSIYQNWNPKFWDPELSWRNKWKWGDPTAGEAFLGSSHILVTFTDGWHLMKTIWIWFICCTVLVYEPITTSIWIDGLLHFATYAAGHHLFFTYFTEQQFWTRIRSWMFR